MHHAPSSPPPKPPSPWMHPAPELSPCCSWTRAHGRKQHHPVHMLPLCAHYLHFRFSRITTVSLDHGRFHIAGSHGPPAARSSTGGRAAAAGAECARCRCGFHGGARRGLELQLPLENPDCSCMPHPCWSITHFSPRPHTPDGFGWFGCTTKEMISPVYSTCMPSLWPRGMTRARTAPHNHPRTTAAAIRIPHSASFASEHWKKATLLARINRSMCTAPPGLLSGVQRAVSG